MASVATLTRTRTTDLYIPIPSPSLSPSPIRSQTLLRPRVTKEFYKAVDDLGLNPAHYHQIEDYLISWLLTQRVEMPRVYLIVLAGMMQKRVINAKVRKTELDARHTKVVICVLMAVLIHSWNSGRFTEPMSCFFHHYYHLVEEFLQREAGKFTKAVRSSLSLADKFKGAGAGTGTGKGTGTGTTGGHGSSIEKSNYQYDFVREHLHLINLYQKEADGRYIQQMNENYIIQSIYQKKIPIRHSDYFPKSLEQMDVAYASIQLSDLL